MELAAACRTFAGTDGIKRSDSTWHKIESGSSHLASIFARKRTQNVTINYRSEVSHFLDLLERGSWVRRAYNIKNFLAESVEDGFIFCGEEVKDCRDGMCCLRVAI